MALEEAEWMGVMPRLGVRASLESKGSGKWQSSGGKKSKFSLVAVQVVTLVETLRTAGRLDSLKLLHFHLGSQLTNIRDITIGLSAGVNRRVFTLNCASWASIFSISMWVVVWVSIMKEPVRSLTVR